MSELELVPCPQDDCEHWAKIIGEYVLGGAGGSVVHTKTVCSEKHFMTKASLMSEVVQTPQFGSDYGILAA